MKKITTGIFMFVVALAFGTNLSATTIDAPDMSISKIDIKPVNKAKVSTRGLTGSYDEALFGLTNSSTPIGSGNYMKKSAVYNGYTYTTYYQKIGNNWVNYKSEEYKANSSRYVEYYHFNANASCTAMKAFSCVNKSGNRYIYKAVEGSKYYTNGKMSTYGNITFSTKNPLIELKTDVRTYYSNGVMNTQQVTYKNESNRQTSKYQIKNNSRGQLLARKNFNAANRVTFVDVRSYYSNKRLSQRVYTYYNGNVSYRAKSSKYLKYRTNGKKYAQKNISFNAKGYPSRMTSYLFNKAGQTRSNKYGNSYRYVTYFKKNSKLITKVVRAKYNKKGKLTGAKKVRANTFSRTYYTAR